MKRNIKLIIEYDGTNYCGFQLQKTENTIQAELEKAIFLLCSEKIKIIGSGRTDSGVHAKGHVVNFKTSANLNEHSIIMGLNSYLPDDIAVKSAKFVSDDFHARFFAKGKTYQYKVWNSKIPSPLNARYAYHLIPDVDINIIRHCAKLFIGEYDFKFFSRAGSSVKTSVRKIHCLNICKKGNLITFTVKGNGFLYNMVRNIVGVLLLAGRGKVSEQDIKDMLERKRKIKHGFTVPACGLCLMRVDYL